MLNNELLVSYTPNLIRAGLEPDQATITFGVLALDLDYFHIKGTTESYCLIHNPITKNMLVDEELTEPEFGFTECINYYMHVLTTDPMPLLQQLKQDISDHCKHE